MRLLATLLVSALVLCLCFAGFVISLEHPKTRGPMRCWITETFYDLSYQLAPPGTPIIEVTSSTQPVVDMCDAADDPAIWVNTQDPEKSLVLGKPCISP